MRRSKGLAIAATGMMGVFLFVTPVSVASAQTTQPDSPLSCGSGNAPAAVNTSGSGTRYFCGLDTGANMSGREITIYNHSAYELLVFSGANRTGSIVDEAWNCNGVDYLNGPTVGSVYYSDNVESGSRC